MKKVRKRYGVPKHGLEPETIKKVRKQVREAEKALKKPSKRRK